MLRQRLLILSGIALLCFAALLVLDRVQPQLLLRLRALERDAVVAHGRTAAANPDLVFLAIDSDSVGLDATDIKELYDLSGSTSLEARALKLMSKSWPWPREVYALVLQRLVDAGAKVVAFDLTFPTETPGDEPFRLALDRYREHAVVASNFISAASRGFSTTGASLTRPPESLIPETTPMDDRVAYSNFWPDEDDVVRHAQYRITFEQAQGDLPEADSERYLSFAALALARPGMPRRFRRGWMNTCSASPRRRGADFHRVPCLRFSSRNIGNKITARANSSAARLSSSGRRGTGSTTSTRRLSAPCPARNSISTP